MSTLVGGMGQISDFGSNKSSFSSLDVRRDISLCYTANNLHMNKKSTTLWNTLFTQVLCTILILVLTLLSDIELRKDRGLAGSPVVGALANPRSPVWVTVSGWSKVELDVGGVGKD